MLSQCHYCYQQVRHITSQGVGVQQDLHPAGAALHWLSGVALTPALGKTQPHGVGIVGPLVGCRVTSSLVDSGELEVEYLHGVSWRYLKHTECSGVWNIQGGGVDKERNLCPVVKPHPGLVATEQNSCKDGKVRLLDLAVLAEGELTEANLVSGPQCWLGSSEIAGHQAGQAEEVPALARAGHSLAGDL